MQLAPVLRLLAVITIVSTGGSAAVGAQNASPSPIATGRVPDGIPTLEPAPPLQMHEFDPFKTKGTGSITGSLENIPTRAFGNRNFHGSTIYIIPQTSYSQYVADEARETWLHFTRVKIDRGVFPWLFKTAADAESKFAFSHLPRGSYLIFAELVDSKATKENPCFSNYIGFDGNGKPAEVKVGVYCYGHIEHDYLFLTGTATVTDGSSAAVILTNNGELVS